MSLEVFGLPDRPIGTDILDERIVGEDVMVWLEFQFYPLARSM